MKPNNVKRNAKTAQPLADRMRPKTLNEFIGQAHILGEGKPLHQAIVQGHLHSLILWGPPGSGKTTLAQLIAAQTHAQFVRLSAIYSGVKEIRQVVEQARIENQQNTLLFVDEIHRFNKSQQDIFLPYVEDGTFILIGATTENPSFELNNALLSRTRVYVLKKLSENELLNIIQTALTNKECGLGLLSFDFPVELQKILARAADGDARQALNLLELLGNIAKEQNGHLTVTKKLLAEIIQESVLRFDKQGEAFYDQISALHKSVRGSSPDAALYWLCRMLSSGCDPCYLARRMIRMAIEDIGLADPRALDITLHAADTYERLGSPEGELALANALVYLAVAAKSNAVYVAFQAASKDAKENGSLEVPLHLRNAPTQLMQSLNYGKNYRYAHDEPHAYCAGENYFPDELKSRTYYQPTDRGLEAKIAERLAFFRELDRKKNRS